jgi:capsular exopolysaccharide synthesis family protein
MSRFFDLLQRLNTGNTSSSEAPVSSCSSDDSSGAAMHRALSALLPRGPRNQTDPDDLTYGQGGDLLSELLTPDGFAARNGGAGTDFLKLAPEQVHLGPESRVLYHTDPTSPCADRFRFLRMRLRELSKSKGLKSLLITSALPEEGKSTVALNLATALAECARKPVLLIEADLHHPCLAQTLGIDSREGLAECLVAGLNAFSAIRRLEPLGFYLLPAGKPHTNPTELLQSEALPMLMQRLVNHFDWILIDSPPTAPLTDALSLSRHANGTLLIARAGRTPREAIEKAVSLLGQEHVIGAILNGVEEVNRVYSQYRAYSGSDLSKKTAPAENI